MADDDNKAATDPVPESGKHAPDASQTQETSQISAGKAAPVSPDPSPAPAAKPVAGASPGAKPAAKSKAATLAGFLFNLLLFGAVGIIGFFVYEQQKAVVALFDQQNSYTSQRNEAFNNYTARIDSLQGTVETLQSAQATARQEITQLVQQQAAAIERLQNELVSTRLRISATDPGASQEWLLAEAASLLRLARQHLVITRSIRTAQALYLAADDILKQVDDPAVFSIREILAGELASIRAIEEVDVRSMFLQLGALAEQVNTLQVTNDLATQVAAGETVSLAADSSVEEPGMFSRFFSRIKSILNTYFVVRRRDVPIQPLMTPGQEAALMQTIRLHIEQGRTALLRGEQEIYSDSLSQARSNISAYLAGDDATRNSILDTLEMLAGQRIVTEVPPLNRTLAALEQILSAQANTAELVEPR